jgi:hypothetical protein
MALEIDVARSAGDPDPDPQDPHLAIPFYQRCGSSFVKTIYPLKYLNSLSNLFL